ncbi:MAG: ribonuclease E/G, partial [Terriglobia bacterium]
MEEGEGSKPSAAQQAPDAPGSHGLAPQESAPDSESLLPQGGAPAPLTADSESAAGEFPSGGSFESREEKRSEPDTSTGPAEPTASGTADRLRSGAGFGESSRSEVEAADLTSRHVEDSSKTFQNSGQNSGRDSGGQSYTLREPSRRPHLAPRRPRRGRGRFRGRPQQGEEGRSTGGPTPSRSSNHQPLPISELLKEGQEIVVQIAKEPLGAKGARITSHIALPGRYLVYMPTIDHIGVSRKIGSEEERLRLRTIILENKGSATGGFIVRTAGAGCSEEEFKADLKFLTNIWNEIRGKAER